MNLNKGDKLEYIMTEYHEYHSKQFFGYIYRGNKYVNFLRYYVTRTEKAEIRYICEFNGIEGEFREIELKRIRKILEDE